MIRFLLLMCWVAGCLASAQAADLPLHTLKLPPGFQIAVYAADVPNARSLAVGAQGTVFVGSRNAGKVYALRDTDQDGRADSVQVIAEHLNMPNGVAFRDGSLYVAEVHRILRYDRIEARLSQPPAPVVVYDRLPSERHHGWKFIAFGPDGKLYVPIGAPCNICAPRPDQYALIGRINPDGTGWEVVARGVRNTVGFDWHPRSGELWFTDNGRDLWGDDRPDDELNRVARAGLHFGYPHCHGVRGEAGGVAPDPEFAQPCAHFVAPVAWLGAHVAALGMRFYRGTQFPASYRHSAFIAQHGSWNRSSKVGYRVVVAHPGLQDSAPVRVEPFVEGWLQGDQAWGRPVDVQPLPDGSLLISDDHAGAIYRISYTAPTPSQRPPDPPRREPGPR